MKGLILDTHVWLWYAEGSLEQLPAASFKALDEARHKPGLRISAISVWEIGVLYRKGRIHLSIPLKEWVDQALAAPGVVFMPIDAAAAVESALLPDEPHGDPADRMLIATARVHGLRLATRDTGIIDYGRAGHVDVLKI